jgi:hypothetical protein
LRRTPAASQGAEGKAALRCGVEREGKPVSWLDPASLVLLVVAVAFLGAAVEMLWEFIRFSGRDPLTPLAPDARSARARRWAGVYVREPQPQQQPATMERERAA